MRKNMNQAIKLFMVEGRENLIAIKKRKALKKQIPNLITLIRLVFLPFIIINILLNNLIIAGILTVIAILSDFFDGFIARKLNAVTTFGAKLDSVVDKIFTITILSSLVFLNYYLIIVIILDIIIATTNSYFIFQGQQVTTIYIGKIKTLFLGILIISLFLTSLYNYEQIIPYLLFITIILQIITLFTYLKKYKKKKGFN